MENNKICPIPNINDIKKFFSINKQTKILPNLSFSENHYTIEDFFIEKNISDKSIFHISQGMLFWIIISILFNIPYQQNFPQKLLGFLWIIVGYKFFLEESFLQFSSPLFNNQSLCIGILLCFLGLLSLLVGFNLLINFAELKKKIKEFSFKSIYRSLGNIISLIAFDSNFQFFNFAKKIFFLGNIEKNITSNDIFNEDDIVFAFFSGENIFKIFLIGVNLLPFFLSNFWGDLFTIKNKSNFLLKNFIPNPIFLACMTYLLKYFISSEFQNGNFISLYNLINLLCYSIYISFIFYEICALKKFSVWNIFYFFLILLNFFAMYYTSSQENIKFGEEKELPFESEISKVKVNYGITYNPVGNSGIQGFLDREFFVDNCGTVANAFLLISNYKWEFIPDTSVRKVKVEPNLIKYVYKLNH